MRSRTMRMRPWPLIVLVAALAVGGCGGRGQAADGPLSSGNSIHGPLSGGSICAPGGQPWAFGLTVFTNYGHSTVVLDRVLLLHPRNEHLVGSYAVPGDRVVGVVHWPPKYPGTPSVPGVPSEWKHRQPVPRFRLAAGKSFNMVLGIAAITVGRRASSRGMLVYYHDSSGSYVAKDNWANIIGAKTRKCD